MIHRLLSLLLSLLTIFNVMSRSQKDAPLDDAPARAAEAIFALAAHDDAAPAMDVFQFEDETALRRAFSSSQRGAYPEDLARELIEQLNVLGVSVSDADCRALAEAVLSALDKLEFSAQVHTIDQEVGTATVVCRVSTMGTGALARLCAGAVFDMELSQLSDPDAAVSAMLGAVTDGLLDWSPTGQTAEVTAPFLFRALEEAGDGRRAWLPADAEGFIRDVFSAALGS